MYKLLIIALLILAAGGIYLFLPRFQKVEKRAGTSLDVPNTVPLNAQLLSNKVIRAFETKSPRPKPFDRFKLATYGAEFFPQDFQLQHYNDPRLTTYSAIAPSLKRNDLYLYDFSDADDPDSYWESEYYYNGAPAKFRCNFIIHLEPNGSDSTQIEILEYAPKVWVGKRFSLGGRHGPGMHLDIRDVESTTKDRVELMKLIKAIATSEP